MHKTQILYLHPCRYVCKPCKPVWANPFLRQGRQSYTKMAADGADEDDDGQGHDPFMVRHARVWSRV